MLEPLYTCNLACIGCSTQRHPGKLGDRLPVETCLRAVDDCGAPTVSIWVFIGLLALPAVDHRLGWSDLPGWAAIAGDVIMLLGPVFS